MRNLKEFFFKLIWRKLYFLPCTRGNRELFKFQRYLEKTLFLAVYKRESRTFQISKTQKCPFFLLFFFLVNKTLHAYAD